MSFQIAWPTFDEDSLAKIRAKLTELMNQGETPEAICDIISVTDLNIGTKVSHGL